jgi:hypothetical protein
MADIVEKRTTESVSVKNTNRWDTEGWCTDKNRVVRTNASFCPFLHSALCSKALAGRLKRPKHLTAGITSSSSADVMRNVFVLGAATYGTSHLKETRSALRPRITTKSRCNALGAVYLSAPTSSAPKHEFRTPTRLHDRRPTRSDDTDSFPEPTLDLIFSLMPTMRGSTKLKLNAGTCINMSTLRCSGRLVACTAWSIAPPAHLGIAFGKT